MCNLYVPTSLSKIQSYLIPKFSLFSAYETIILFLFETYETIIKIKKIKS